MRRSSIGATVLVAMCLLAACATANTDKLRTRAAYDLRCDSEKLKLTELDSGAFATGGDGAVYGVDGCGNRATYIYKNGTWIMDSGESRKKDDE